MVFFIGCVKKKKKGLLKAKDKYDSDLFKKELAFARKYVNDEFIYILSAKYGIIKLNDLIDDYDLTLNKFTKKKKQMWAYEIIKKAELYNIKKNTKIVFLCGKNYSEYLKKYYKNYEDPTYNLSLGNTLKWYKEHI